MRPSGRSEIAQYSADIAYCLPQIRLLYWGQDGK